MRHAVQTTTRRLIAKYVQATHQAQRAHQIQGRFSGQTHHHRAMRHAVRATHNLTHKYVAATQQTQHARTPPAQHAAAVEQHVAVAQAAAAEDADNNMLINQNYWK